MVVNLLGANLQTKDRQLQQARSELNDQMKRSREELQSIRECAPTRARLNWSHPPQTLPSVSHPSISRVPVAGRQRCVGSHAVPVTAQPFVFLRCGRALIWNLNADSTDARIWARCLDLPAFANLRYCALAIRRDYLAKHNELQHHIARLQSSAGASGRGDAGRGGGESPQRSGGGGGGGAGGGRRQAQQQSGAAASESLPCHSDAWLDSVFALPSDNAAHCAFHFSHLLLLRITFHLSHQSPPQQRLMEARPLSPRAAGGAAAMGRPRSAKWRCVS